MNKLKEQILKESFDYKGIYLEENISLKDLALSFYSDKKIFEEETINLYVEIFGEDIKPILEEVDNKEEEVSEFLRKGKINLLEGPLEIASQAYGGHGGGTIWSAGGLPNAGKIALKGAAKALQQNNVALGKQLIQKSVPQGFLQRLLGGGMGEALKVLGPIAGGAMSALAIWRLIRSVFGGRKKRAAMLAAQQQAAKQQIAQQRQ